MSGSGSADHIAAYAVDIAVLIGAPILSLLGTTVLNIWESNWITLVSIAFDVAIILLYSVLRKRGSNNFYAMLSCSIGLSFLLMTSMRSYHLYGYDINGEYYVYQNTLNNNIWQPIYAQNPGPGQSIALYSSCLSITILPTIISLVTGIQGEILFKFLYPTIFSFSLPVLYLMYHRDFQIQHAFLVTLLMLNTTFVQEMPGLARQEIGLFLFILVMYIMFSKEANTTNWILILILSFGIITSHYSTGWTYLFVIIMLFFSNALLSTRNGKHKLYTKIHFPMVLFTASLSILWYLVVTYTPFSLTVSHLVTTFQGFTDFFAAGRRNLQPLGFGAREPFGLTLLQFTTQYGILVLALIGLIFCIFTLKSQKTIIRSAAFLGFGSVALISITVVLPYASLQYGTERLYLTLLPFFIIFLPQGISYMLKRLHQARAIRLASVIILGLVVLQVFVSTGLASMFFGFQNTVRIADFNSVARLREASDSRFYVFDQEVYAAHWLGQVYQKNNKVYADEYGTLRLWSFGNIARTVWIDRNISENSQLGDYAFLRYENIAFDEITVKDSSGQIRYEGLEQFGPFLAEQNKIYDGGQTQLYVVSQATHAP